jgi:hypothetical protein
MIHGHGTDPRVIPSGGTGPGITATLQRNGPVMPLEDSTSLIPKTNSVARGGAKCRFWIASSDEITALLDDGSGDSKLMQFEPCISCERSRVDSRV